MTIILFLVDTSASMCQKAYVNGVQKTYLDIAKGAVETFLKYRQRTQDCLGDRYMLLTFEEPPANVKAGWKENHATFMNELKNLQSTGLTSMGESLKNAFDLLNLNRMQSGIDTYGQGRCPFYLEPSVIIVITDGGRYSFRNGVHQEIILPLNTQIPGTKFTKEPFRWDQRLFSLVLRMSGNKIDERVEGKVPHDDSPIERMCEVTGGRSYRVRSHYVLNQCIESLVQKVQPGVVLQFEPMMLSKEGIGGSMVSETLQQDIVFQPTKKMIYVQKHISQKTFPIGYWPLPEPYWPDPKALTLPPRDAHPKLKIVTPAVDEPQMVRNFPVDKYEIEASPLTLQILQKREMNKCWQVIISNGMHGFELPFGYLKAAPNYTQVHLYVLAYNYPALLPLLHDLIHKYNMSPPNDLMYKFNAYVRSIPPYYCPFLRKTLLNINVPYPLLQFMLPENVDNYLSPSVANQLKHIKNTAKQDQENLCLKVYKQLKQPKPPYRQIETAKLNPGVTLRRDLVRNPLLRETFAKLHAEIEPLEIYTVVVPQSTRQPSAKSYRNPFDIPRRDLIEEITRMRDLLLRPTPSTSLVAKDSGHCLPIAEMGNYQEYLKNKDNPLREIEPTNVRQHMFGNPYKKDKHMVMVDEADLSDVAAAPMKSPNGAAGASGVPGQPTGVGVMGIVGGGVKKIDASRSRKRKAGPIRKDFIFRRTSIDLRPCSPTSSIASSCSSASSATGIPCSSSSSSAASSICSSYDASIASLSDFDDADEQSGKASASGSDSTTSSALLSSPITNHITDDVDPDRLVVAFDFNEDEPADQDFPLNGYVRNFINGIGDEGGCDSELVTSTAATTVAGAAAAAATSASGISGVIAASDGFANLPPPTMLGLSSNGIASVPAAATATTTHPYVSNFVQPLLGGAAIGIANTLASSSSSSSLSSQASLSAAAPTSHHHTNGNAFSSNVAAASGVVASATPASVFQHHTPHHYQNHHQQPHNDINDAQEISRILQQCHNGHNSPVNNSMDVAMEGENGVATPASVNSTSPASITFSNFDNLKRDTSNVNNIQLLQQQQQQQQQRDQHQQQLAASNHKNCSIIPTLTAAPALTEEQREAARKHNLEIRTQVFRDIRRPGRNYSQLLDHLDLIKGDLDMKTHFVNMCISESLRFRRKQMVNSIQEWWDKKQQQLVQQLAITTSS